MTVADPLFAWLTTRVAPVPAGAVPGSPACAARSAPVSAQSAWFTPRVEGWPRL